MAIKLTKFPLNDSLDLLNHREKLEMIRQSHTIKNPFMDLNFLTACLGTTGSDETYLVYFQEDETPIDFLILKNSQGNLYRTPIPPEIPHFYTLSILDKFPHDFINLLKSEFGKVLLTNIFVSKISSEALESRFAGATLTTRNYYKLQAPEDFERWIYRVKPKKQEKFGKMLKEFIKGKVKLAPVSDPLDIQQKVEIALNKRGDLSLLSRNLVATMLLELKTVGFNIEYNSLLVEKWEVGGMLSFDYQNILYVMQQWAFFENSKYDIEDLLALIALKNASDNKMKEIVILQDIKLETIPAEALTVCDLYLS